MVTVRSRCIAVSNQKGGVGKTVSCVNLGIGLAQEGKKVLLIDADPQGSLTISLGYEEPDEMEYSLATLMLNIVNDITITFCEMSGDKMVTKGTYAKMARGEMVRFIAENNIENPVEIQKFDRLGYSFRSDLSSDSEYVFERKIK